MACFTEALTDTGVDSEERQKSVGDICVKGNISSPNISHSSKPAGFENAVCKQPTLFKINSLFFTDEDLDDTF